MSRKWKYKVISTYPLNLQNVLNELGDNSWELINANYFVDSDDIMAVELILKKSYGIGVTFIPRNNEEVKGAWE